MENVEVREVVFSSAGSMYNTLRRGIGMAFCPLAAVRDDLEAGRLVRLDWKPGPTETTVFMIRHADKWCSPSVRRFMDISLETIRPGAAEEG